MSEVVASIRQKRPDLSSNSAAIHTALVEYDQRLKPIEKPKVSAVPPEWEPVRR